MPTPDRDQKLADARKKLTAIRAVIAEHQATRKELEDLVTKLQTEISNEETIKGLPDSIKEMLRPEFQPPK